jgi:peptidoglycan hydrolase-like protein with peptidoglycan-binding domain
MRFILKESQLGFLLEQISYDPNVEIIQKYLIKKGYDLGKYGPNKDGVDGKLGPLTRGAMEQEFGLKIVRKGSSSQKTSGEYDAILVGGLDNRSGDLNIDSQVSLLKQGIGTEKNVKGFRFNTPSSTIIDFINKNPGIPIYLFSAGCRKSNEISNVLGQNKNNLFIIEPYAAGSETKNNVRNAVNNGVPASNVFVGNSVGRGQGIVIGASSSKSDSHWNALKTVGSMTKNN